jgi:hypothetical protein
LTMKWSHRIARGFSPGWTSPKTALKVATEWGPFIPARPSQTLTPFKTSSLDSTPHIRSPLSGRSWRVTPPRAKALGYSVRPFHGQELASARPKSFALEHDSLVNPTLNPEKRSAISQQSAVISNQCVSNQWLMGGRGFLTMKWSHRIAQGFRR